MMRFNERADMAAKEALRLDNKIVNGSITLASCKRLVAKYMYMTNQMGTICHWKSYICSH